MTNFLVHDHITFLNEKCHFCGSTEITGTLLGEILRGNIYAVDFFKWFFCGEIVVFGNLCSACTDYIVRLASLGYVGLEPTLTKTEIL